MNDVQSLARLRALRVPVIETADAAAALKSSTSATSHTLKRLARAGLIARVRHGLWSVDPQIDPSKLVATITAPLGSYISLQSALWRHGMIEQVPVVTYVVSLARTQSITTTLGTFAIHHIAPALFGGFHTTPEGVPIATPEKALFDLAYLSGGRSRLFAAVPELELPRRFDRRELDRWMKKIASRRGRTLVSSRLQRWLSQSMATEA